MKCNQCEYLFINGIGCHETGCPNNRPKLKCFECGYVIPDNCDGNCTNIEELEVA